MRSATATGRQGLGSLAMALLACVAALWPGPAALPLDLTPQERAGKRIFLEGESPSGAEIGVRIGREGTPLPAGSAPCGSCHGRDGLGRPEGGVVPTEITWTVLSRPYGHEHPGGRSHPAFDARGLARAIREGRDPAGNALDPIMPRYSISDADLASLVAYLKVVERDLDPGIGPSSLRVGVVLPDRGRLADVGGGMLRVLRARVDEIGRAGGIHGRRLELVVAGYDSDASDGRAEAERLLDDEPILALVSGFFPGAEDAVAALAEARGVPVVGPHTLVARQDDPVNPWVFHLQGGPREQARLLVAHATGDLGVDPGRIAVVPPAGPAAEDVAGAARAAAGANGNRLRVVPADGPPGSLVRELSAAGVQAVVFLGGDEPLAALLAAAAAARFTPWILASGTAAARAALKAPAPFRGRLRLVLPSSPADETPAGTAELERIRAAAGTLGRGRTSQAAALVAMDVLVEGLRRSGRQLSRERLVASLEGLWEFPSGILHPVTFGPARRIGAPGGWIVEVDPATGSFSAVGGWRPLE